jgi:hypothetical protein
MRKKGENGAPSFPSETAIPPDEIMISPLVSKVNPCVTQVVDLFGFPQPRFSIPP